MWLNLKNGKAIVNTAFVRKIGIVTANTKHVGVFKYIVEANLDSGERVDVEMADSLEEAERFLRELSVRLNGED